MKKVGGLFTCSALALMSFAALPLSAAELTHRWSFNGDYSDSVGGVDAVKCGTYVSLYGGRVHMGYGPTYILALAITLALVALGLFLCRRMTKKAIRTVLLTGIARSSGQPGRCRKQCCTNV